MLYANSVKPCMHCAVRGHTNGYIVFYFFESFVVQLICDLTNICHLLVQNNTSD